MAKENDNTDPAYKKIYEGVIEDIKNGSAGKISVNNVAEKYGVNRNTADKAINMLEQNGWVRRVKRKGTFPVEQNSGKIYSINILYDHDSFQHNFLNSYPFVHVKLIDSIFKSELMSRCNLQMLFMDSTESVDRRRQKLLSLGAKSGLVILDPLYGFDDIMKIIKTEHIPYITFTDPVHDINTVFHKHWNGTSKAVEYLIKASGRKKIMFLSNERKQKIIKPRYEAYLNALKANDIDFSEEFAFDLDVNNNENVQELVSILKSKKFDGIFASSFIVGEKVYQILKILDIKIPEETALIVFHDTPSLSNSSPTVTAVKAPLELIGKTMLEKLVEMIDFGYRDDIRILYEDELIIRSST
ncbi:MAG: hypothetical protein A2017_10185 [Lentisphaerae bacterium GWF2_44_16]|nr:MAG: hypothetical protein A2017_10185 [Lentisphaerae bacterium GWF2_44_16]